MKIEIDDRLKPAVLRVAKTYKVTPNEVVESAVIFTFEITQLSTKKQATIQQWVEEEKLKKSANQE